MKYVSTRGQAPVLNFEETMLYRGDAVLLHGDLSPKNILFRDAAPILLDAECATMGDASFDPAFCLNHLILKAIHLPASRERLLSEVGKFWQTYENHINGARVVDKSRGYPMYRLEVWINTRDSTIKERIRTKLLEVLTDGQPPSKKVNPKFDWKDHS